MSIARAQAGFTLPELMIAMVITTLVLTGAYSVFFTFSRSMKNSMEHLDQAAETQYAFQALHKEMRAISAVHTVTNRIFEFTTTHMDGTDERIKYYYDPQTEIFYRESITDDTTRDLLHNVTSATFEYYELEDSNNDGLPDSGGTPNTIPAIDVNAAKLSIESQRNITGGTRNTQTETAIVTFRNKTL